MIAFIVNQNKEATEIFEYDGFQQPLEYKLFYAENTEEGIQRLLTIKSLYKVQKEKLTKEVIAKMKELRANMDLLPLKDMIEKYLCPSPCCLPLIDELLDGLK